MQRLLDTLEAMTRATSVDAVWRALARECAAFGFDRLLYGYTRNLTARSLGQPEDLLILSSHEAAYADRFIGERMFLHAPMLRWAAGHDGACSWAYIRAHRASLTPEERRVAEFNRRMGVTAGWTVSFPTVSPRAKGALALAARAGLTQADADAIWAAEGRRIEAMATVAHLKILTLPHSGGRRPLTARQREVLEWVGEGKTMQEIATILGLTPATVEKHLRLAREALEVGTTAQAVLKAAYQNQIFVPEP